MLVHGACVVQKSMQEAISCSWYCFIVSVPTDDECKTAKIDLNIVLDGEKRTKSKLYSEVVGSC